LIDELQAAVVGAPNEFLPLLGTFRAARPEFQYAVLNGFKQLLGPSEAAKSKFDWPAAARRQTDLQMDCSKCSYAVAAMPAGSVKNASASIRLSRYAP
jgi:hypothetical protein